MTANILRATAFAALTSCIGYAVMSYRKKLQLRAQRESEKTALQQWESDGGASPAAASSAPAPHTYSSPAGSPAIEGR